MPLYFIRHGESEANERNQFAGRQDSPLTRLGGEQAEQAGRAIIRKGLVFVGPLSSPARSLSLPLHSDRLLPL